jgi:replicative DNA helicase
MSGPIHDTDAERNVVGCCLLEAQALDLVGDLRPDDFFIPAYQAIFEAIRDLRYAGKAIDVLTVGDVLKAKGHDKLLEARGEMLTEIANIAPIWLNVKHWAEIVARDGARRRILQLCGEIGERTKADVDVSGLLVEARRRLADLEAPQGPGPVRLGDRIREGLAAIAARSERPEEAAVLTGIRRFDDEIGGFRPGQLVVVAARPGIGKTAFAGTVALRAAMRSVPVLVFSLEMSWQEMFERFLGALERISVETLSRGKADYNQFKRLYKSKLGELPLWVDDRALSMGQIVGAARAWRARQTASQALIVIDYLGLIRNDSRAETRTLEVGRMAWAAKMLAKESKTPVMLVSQLNRASEIQGREPVLSDLRDSGEIEQHADQVLFPHREPPLDQSGPSALIVAKHRGGRTGRIRCHWHAEYMSFEEAVQGGMDDERAA